MIMLTNVCPGLKHEDIIFLERLTAVSNVIVLISKSDTLSPEEIEAFRRSISGRLEDLNICTFRFTSENARQPPFTVCSAPSEDDDNMDASLLMSPDYVQPLIASDLSILISQLLDEDTASCLRHLAATRLVRARRGSSSFAIPAAMTQTLSDSVPGLARSPSSASHGMTTRLGAGMSPYVQARIADHTKQEEKLAQIRLAKWAVDLQRSLQNERIRYEAMARGEQAAWLNERLDDTDSLDPLAKDSALIKKPDRRYHPRAPAPAYQYGLADADDPLGLLRWNEIMRQRGWLALQVAGGFGILGAVVVWAARTWSANGSSLGEWNWPWWREA